MDLFLCRRIYELGFLGTYQTSGNARPQLVIEASAKDSARILRDLLAFEEQEIFHKNSHETKQLLNCVFHVCHQPSLIPPLPHVSYPTNLLIYSV